MPQSIPLSVEVVSDVVCPWCFIGKKRIETAIALKPDIPVALQFRAYFLNDWIPREGISRTDYLVTKFGSVERYAQIAERVKAAAADEGLVYAPDKISRQPNTTDCHRLILWAGTSGRAVEMKQRLMDIYFTEGGDLTSNEVLAQAAADVGLDRTEISRLLATEQDIDSVARQTQNAKDAGIDGVPCFIFGGAFAVSGAQAPDYLAGAIERAAGQIAESPASVK